MKTFLAPALIHSFHRRPLLLAYPAAVFLLVALAGWLSVAGSGSAASFAIDHFKCYDVQNSLAHTDTVILTDQFGTTQNNINGRVAKLCNPVQKTHNMVVTPITNPDSHLMVYPIIGPAEPQRFVTVDNQFGQQQLILNDAVYLLVPSQKQPFGLPHDLDHFKCYLASGPPVSQVVDLQDQFHTELNVQVIQPDFFCNPTQKVHNAQTFPITNPTDHLLCYRISAPTFSTLVNTNNQIGPEFNLQTTLPSDLCVPTLKLTVNTATPTPTPTPTPSPTPPPPVVLDHFKCYVVQGPQSHQPETVRLTDQFNLQDRLVSQVVRHCNPVEKTHNQVVTPITNPESHLTWYQLSTMTEPTRFVTVSNQFGQQQLVVQDARFLLVPTQKQPFGPPHDLDHFKCYVASGPPLDQLTVDLRDQFDVEPQVQVLQPNFLCNPVEKIHNAIDYPIMHPLDHLVCYGIVGTQVNISVQSVSQFNPPQSYIALQADELCVPSQKLPGDADWDGVLDPTDNCPYWYNPGQGLPPWPVPAGDSDCDGFPDSVPVPAPNALSDEGHMGTDPFGHCASTTGVSPAVRNDEGPPDRWPVDFDDNGIVNGSDLLTFAAVFGSVSPVPPYNARWDMNNSNSINGSDLLKFGPFFGKTCA